MQEQRRALQAVESASDQREEQQARGVRGDVKRPASPGKRERRPQSSGTKSWVLPHTGPQPSFNCSGFSYHHGENAGIGANNLGLF